jgi:hypothetical protein
MFNAEEISEGWQHYFDDLNFACNYHTIRFVLSELIPSILVAVFNAAIIVCIIRTSAHVRRRRREYYCNHPLSMSMITGFTSKGAAPETMPALGRFSSQSTSISIRNIPFGKISWMNAVLLFHSLLFFFSSTITSLVYLSTSDMILAYWISVVILANCSLNFYLYCLSGEQFRVELKRIGKRFFRCLHKKCCGGRTHRHASLPMGKDAISPSLSSAHEYRSASM